MSEILTPTSERWNWFCFALTDKLTIDAQRWRCDGDRGPNRYRYAKKVMAEMGGVNIDETISFFQSHGGYCDCEILMNVDPETLRAGK